MEGASNIAFAHQVHHYLAVTKEIGQRFKSTEQIVETQYELSQNGTSLEWCPSNQVENECQSKDPQPLLQSQLSLPSQRLAKTSGRKSSLDTMLSCGTTMIILTSTLC